MRPRAKVGLVAAGYILALVVAAVVAAAAVAFHVLVTSGPHMQGYSGMYAFFDGLVFLAAFAVASVLPTATALFFLRPYRAFWRVCSVVALVVALTAPAAFIEMTIDPRAVLAALAFLRILVAPLFVLLFLLSACFAPNRASRITLLVATVLETTGFAGWLAACCLRSS
jgi:hypothetical protein